MYRALGLLLVAEVASVPLAGCQSDRKSPPPTKGPASGSGLTGTATSASAASGSTSAADPSASRPPAPPLPDPLPGTRVDLTATIGVTTARAAIGDLDGDRKAEIVACDAAAMIVLDASGTKKLGELAIADGIQQLVVADVDGDGKAEIYAGWGQTREHTSSKARISVVRFDHGVLREQPILQPATTRDDSVAIVPMPDTKMVLYAYFDSKYMVTSTLLAPAGNGWTSKDVAHIRTATSYARGDVDGDGKPDLVVGRVYGDGIGIDGDAFVLGVADGKRTAIPSTRGMRSIAVIDGAVYMGDGWHQSYAAMARGLLSRSKIVGGAFVTNVIEDTPGQYGIEGIIPATIENMRVIVTRGSHTVRAFRPNGDKWEAATIAGLARDVAVGDVDGKPGDEILILGEKKTELVNLEGITWRPIP